MWNKTFGENPHELVSRKVEKKFTRLKNGPIGRLSAVRFYRKESETAHQRYIASLQVPDQNLGQTLKTNGEINLKRLIWRDHYQNTP